MGVIKGEPDLIKNYEKLEDIQPFLNKIEDAFYADPPTWHGTIADMVFW